MLDGKSVKDGWCRNIHTGETGPAVYDGEVCSRITLFAGGFRTVETAVNVGFNTDFNDSHARIHAVGARGNPDFCRWLRTYGVLYVCERSCPTRTVFCAAHVVHVNVYRLRISGST